MALFAQLDSFNIVQRIIGVGDTVITDAAGNESELLGIAFCQQLAGPETIWKRCSRDGNIRFNAPSVGFEYDPIRDAFIAPKPSGQHWKLSEKTCRWYRTAATRLEIATQEAREFVEEKAAAEVEAITSQYPGWERETFQDQVEEARLIQGQASAPSDPLGIVPLLATDYGTDWPILQLVAARIIGSDGQSGLRLQYLLAAGRAKNCRRSGHAEIDAILSGTNDAEAKIAALAKIVEPS